MSQSSPRVSADIVAVKIAVLLLCCLTAAGCGEVRAASDADRPPTVTIAGTPVPVPPTGRSDDVIDVGIDGSVSDLNQRPELLRDLAQVVLPEAARRESLLVASVVGSNGFNAGSDVVQVDFKVAALGSDTVDATRLTSEADQRVVGSLAGALAGAPPSPASDPLGFLRRLADTRAQFPKAHLLGVYLGDGAESVPGCDLSLSATTTTEALKATEIACLGGRPIRLPGVEVWLLGVGAAPAGGGMSAAQAITAQTFITDLVRLAGGTVTKASAHPIAGGS